MSTAAHQQAQVALAMGMIMVGCFANVVFLEAIVQYDIGAGTALTFCQFTVIAFEGLLLHLRWPSKSWLPRLAPRVIPLRYYIVMTSMFVALSVTNNYVFAFGISIPMHTVLRSSSLAVSLLIGLVVLRKSYTRGQIAGVVAVSAGIFLAVLADAAGKHAEAAQAELRTQGAERIGTSGQPGCCDDELDPAPEPALPMGLNPFTCWLVGVSMLVFALVTSSALGHMQQYTYQTFGGEGKPKPHRESMFYSHLLSLPYFALGASDLASHFQLWSQSPPWVVPWTDSHLPVPTVWVLVLFNVITQYICIHGVYTLTGLTSTLTCTLTITVRKFLSLVFSVFYFENEFTGQHWIGTALVFLGLLVYWDLVRVPWAGGPGSTPVKPKTE